MNYKTKKLVRKHKKSVLLNDKEIAVLNQYCEKYKVKNRSKLIRESLFSSIMGTFEDDYPTLFDKRVLAGLEKY